MSRKGVLVCMLAGLALCIFGAATTLAVPPACSIEDLTGRTFANACTGTNVTITKGARESCVRIVTDGEGGTHTHITFYIQAMAVDDAGNRYVVNGVASEPINLNSSGSTDHTTAFYLNTISLGKAPNFRCRIQAHVTVNANGDITSSFFSQTGECECAPE